MYKKYLIPALAAVILGFSIWGYIIMRQSSVSSKTDLYISVPDKPCVIFQINRLKEFEESLLYNNNYWLNLTALKPLNKTHILLSALDSLKDTNDEVNRLITDRTVLISAYHTDSIDAGLLLSAQIPASGYEATKQILAHCSLEPDNMVYYNEFLLVSNSKELIERAKSSIDKRSSPTLEDSIFAKVRKFAGDKQEATVFINADRARWLIDRGMTEVKESVLAISDQYNSWGCYDVDFSEDKIEVNGFAYCDKEGGVPQAFRNQNTDRNTLSAAMPYNTYFFRHFAIPNFEDYRAVASPDIYSENGVGRLETTSGESPLTFFQDYFGGEIVYGSSPLERFVIVKLYNSKEAISTLRRIALELNPESSLKRSGVEMFHLGKNGFAGSIFGSLFTLNDEYICIANGNLIITPTAHATSYIASRNPLNNTLQCSPVFRSADRTLLSTSNRSIYVDIPYIVRNARRFFSNSIASEIRSEKEMWSNFDCIGMQSENNGGGFDYQHVFIQYSGERGTFDPIADEPLAENATPVATTSELVADASGAVAVASGAVADASGAVVAASEAVADTSKTTEPAQNDAKKLFSVKLDAPAQIAPQKFTNHYTGENEIFIQDTKNNIYLISASGKILWKTTVSEPIIGGIKEVDILKNKKLQIAFVTKSKLYVIDRNGRLVAGYPKQNAGDACTPLSVFDYEGNKDYRFAYGTSNNRVYITKKDGTTLKEWSNVYTKSPIDGPIKHLRIGNKDYIVFADADKSYFLDRKANHRLSCGATLLKSKGNEIYTDIPGHKMVMTLTNGKICFIAPTDKATSTQLKEYGTNHIFIETADCYVFGYEEGIDFYDSDMNLVYSDNKSSVSGIKACTGLIVAYNKASGILRLYKHNADGSFTTGYIKGASEYFTATPLKPYSLPVAVVCNGNELNAYAF